MYFNIRKVGNFLIGIKLQYFCNVSIDKDN